jgi:enoyl-CoA hydratase/carnithine racemase
VPVVFSELECRDGQKIGWIHLNTPKALNAISLEMVDLMAQRLQLWAQRADIRCVFLDSEGDKAFSAGGDIRKLYDSMCLHPQGPNPYAEDFFSREYRFNFNVHNYSKPIVAFGHGYVMGGGLGLFVGCSHRIVSQSTQLTWPEIKIGLYPDVAASYYLSRMPLHWGRFIGLSGALLNAQDCLLSGLADVYLADRQKMDVLRELQAQTWQGDSFVQVDRVLTQLEAERHERLPESLLTHNDAALRETFTTSDLASIERDFSQIATQHPWLQRAWQNYQMGCPVTALLVLEQIRRAQNMPLNAVVKMEWAMSIYCTRHGDFREGVRARIIDKDNSPQWRFARWQDVPESYIENYFMWPNMHPLADL